MGLFCKLWDSVKGWVCVTAKTLYALERLENFVAYCRELGRSKM